VKSGKRVFLVLPSPTGKMLHPYGSLPNRFASNWRATELAPGDAGIDAQSFRSAVEPMVNRLRAVAAQSGARLIDPMDTLCDQQFCKSSSPDGVLRYRDGDHLRADYARTLPYLDTPLRGD